MKLIIKLSDINYTGAFGGVWFKESIAEVDAISPRLERVLKVTGKTVEVLSHDVAGAPAKKATREPAAKRKPSTKKVKATP